MKIIKYLIISLASLFLIEAIILYFTQQFNKTEFGIFGPLRALFFIYLITYFLQLIKNKELANTRKAQFNYNLLIIIFILYLVLNTFITGSFFSNISALPKFSNPFLVLVLAIMLINSSNWRETRNSTLTILLFINILIFLSYPKILIESNINLSNLLETNKIRLNGLLGAANEDGHFIATSLPMLLIIINKKYNRVLYISVVLVILFLNGTRSSLFYAIFAIFLIIFFDSKFKLFFSITFVLVFIFSTPFLVEILNHFLQGESFNFINNSNLHSVDYEGGTFEGRVLGIWFPIVDYVINTNTWLFGNGIKSWDEVAKAAGVVGYGMTPSGVKWVIRAPHNIYIFLFATLGIAGVMIIGMIIFKNCINLLINYIKNGNRNAIKLLISWGSFINWSMVANPHGKHGFFMFVTLCLVSFITFNYEKKSQFAHI